MSKDIRKWSHCVALAAALAALPATAVRADEAQTLKRVTTVTTLTQGTLQVCLYPGFAPFAYKENGNWKGWDYDYLQGFAKAINLKLEVVEMELFNDIWLQPGKGVCDIAGTGISDTADRRKATGADAGPAQDKTDQIGCWSQTYYGVLRTFMVRTQDFARLEDVRDLAGKTAIVTKGSTANTDLCYRMKLAGLSPCVRKDQDHPCQFKGLQGFKETTRQEDGSCVDIEYPQDNDEAKAAVAVANVDNKTNPPFTYGGGYGSIQTLVCDTKGQNLALVWPHCNMGSDFQAYSEPFSFIVRAADTGLLAALNQYLQSAKYPGTSIPDLGCRTPPWSKAPQPEVCKP
jgi:hypothetical protein